MHRYYRDSIESDIDIISQNLRNSDRKEIQILGEESAEYHLTYGYRESEVCKTIVLDGSPSAMFGIARTSWGGVPWLLSTTDFKFARFSFLKKSKKWLDNEIQSYGLLRNIVHDQNEAAIGWLKFLGFQFTGKVPIQKDNKYYYFWKFERRVI